MTSARVGAGEKRIDSSICVATTTGLPSSRQVLMMLFWICGTLSAGTSTPRSPRATMIASLSSAIARSWVTADGFSILAIR
ncbi:hypothetical protein D3C80_1743040 [compost metagenome]